MDAAGKQIYILLSISLTQLLRPQCMSCFRTHYHSEIRHPEEKIPETLRVRQALSTSAKQAKTQVPCSAPGCRMSTKNAPRAANKLCTNKLGPLCSEHCYPKGCRTAHNDPKRGYKAELQDTDDLNLSGLSTAVQPQPQSACHTRYSSPTLPSSPTPKSEASIQPRQLYGRPLNPRYRYRDPQAEQEAIRKRATLEARILEEEAKIVTLYFYYDVSLILFMMNLN